MGLAVGIDLGTTYSCVAHYDTNTDNVQIFRNRDDRRTSQSIVTFTNEEALVSCDATPTYARWPLSTVSNVKRLMGRMYADPEIKADAEKLPYEVVDQDGKAAIRVKYREKMEVFQPEQISAMILTKMKEIAEDTLGEQVTDAVITVPAYFDDAQRQATKDAARIAGLNVLRIINEPTAAALAYGHDNAIKDGRNILVYDLGGGTFDVSIVSIKNDAYEVKATGGNTHLGGEDFDSRLVNYCVKDLEVRHHVNVEGNAEAMARLRSACKTAKEDLVDRDEKTITIPRLFGNVDFTCTISRETFETLCLDLFTLTLETIRSVLTNSGLNKDNIDEIVLVGGSSRIPKIQELIRDMFNGKALSRRIDPDEAVAYGAAIQASLLSDRTPSNISSVQLMDVTPLSLGIQDSHGRLVIVVSKNSPIPLTNSHIFTTANDNQTSMLFAVYQGERPRATDNTFLGRFRLSGIPEGPRGTVDAQVTLDINLNGILRVAAVNEDSNVHSNITISGSGRLPREEIDRAIQEAERNRSEDQQFGIRVSALERLESYIYPLRREFLEKRNTNDMSESTFQRVIQPIESAIAWIEATQGTASAYDYNEKRDEVEFSIHSIVRAFRLQHP